MCPTPPSAWALAGSCNACRALTLQSSISPEALSTSPGRGSTPSLPVGGHSLPILGPFHLGRGDPRGLALQLHPYTSQAQHLLRGLGSKHGRWDWGRERVGGEKSSTPTSPVCCRAFARAGPLPGHPSPLLPGPHGKLPKPLAGSAPALCVLSCRQRSFVARNAHT